MVLFFTSTALAPEIPSVLLYMGRDKVENEDLIRYHYENDVWTHVDKLSSAHVYLRLPPSIQWDSIPEALLIDAAQLVKANSIIGNKKNDLTIIYTLASNLKKTGDMAVGQVSFHSDKKVKRIHIPERVNAIINRLNKTKLEKEVDHESDKVERLKEEAKVRRADANIRANIDLNLARERKAAAEQRGYANLHTVKKGMEEEEEDNEWLSKQKVGDYDPDDDFM